MMAKIFGLYPDNTPDHMKSYKRLQEEVMKEHIEVKQVKMIS
jgi:hypothetical protein